MKDGGRPGAAPALAVGRASTHLRDLAALTKPRLNVLVVATSGAGYYLGAPDRVEWLPMAGAIAGTALVAGGAAVLNQVYECRTDALMRRTRFRPLPDGRVAPAEATLFGVILSGVGLGLLVARANPLTALLAAATLGIYLIAYTPMKRHSRWATLVGAVCGALPPLIGWTASHGSVSPGGGALFAIVFLWQIPHFMAIAWMCRDDYRTAGFPMLPAIEPDGRRTGRLAVGYTLALLPVSLAPSLVGVSGSVYAAVALVLGCALLWLAVRFAVARDDASARRLFFASLIYLPSIWTAMIVNRL